ncbi:MAG TPA: 50S ribosomal protein L3 N(5)-glutamine methyltransferase [Gammaproteobacteria bacterium]|nr:50S ribosomal protein L3 N(5)-glutamine methyltransferase [Gammaproteobacteria bacterium]
MQQPLNSELLTLRDWIRWAASQFEQAELFYGHGTDNALDEAYALVIQALSLSFDLPQTYLESHLTMPEKERISELIEQRIDTRKPLPYLLNRAWFAGLEFYVDERVLVPRSPISELIEAGFQPWLGDTHPGSVLDCCTGSACIALACAHAFPEAQVVATDISDDALAVAQINIDRHGMSGRVQALVSDVFNSVPKQAFDLIVSNPPYVSATEWQALPEEYHQEPRLGLEAPDQGLEIVLRILREAHHYLSDEGLLVVEVGFSRPALEQRLPEVPFVWPEFGHGGEGVFILTRAQLKASQSLLS